MDLKLQKFSEIDLTDTFFDSLKASYPEFDSWFKKNLKQERRLIHII